MFALWSSNGQLKFHRLLWTASRYRLIRRKEGEEEEEKGEFRNIATEHRDHKSRGT